MRADWEQFTLENAAHKLQAPSQPDFLKILAHVWACSEFVSRSCISQPDLLADLLHSGDLLRDYTADYYHQQLQQATKKIHEETALSGLLRRIRRREMVRIAWRDLAGWASLEETLRDMSTLSGAIVHSSLRYLYAWHCRALGTPWDEAHHHPVTMVVLGMGKLGAGELNFSSDIDLIFAYTDDGETRGKRPPLSNEEFFTRLGQALIGLLHTATSEGRVYRVDMRLRPYGNSGPLAMSFAAMEDYYQSQGRPWERYAMIKARPVGGDPHQGERLMRILQPFVYRRYLDYNALESLREMKAMIDHEVARRSLRDNIKLGPGGIREVEFIGQAFQLIRGGREPALQARGILEVLACLEAHGHLPSFARQELAAAYRFLRLTENRLQAWTDEQSHHLPEDDTGRKRLALSMGFQDWRSFLKQLDSHRRQVANHFAQVFAAPQLATDSTQRDGGTVGDDLTTIWLGATSDEAAQKILLRSGFGEAGEMLRRLRLLQQSHACRMLSSHGRQRLDQLMPLLIQAVGAGPSPEDTLPRILNLIEAVLRRTAYLALLAENPLALSQLVSLCATSPWIAEQLAQQPLLLDELLDPRSLYAPLSKTALEEELRMLLAAIPDDDQEQQMERLRYFKQVNVLRVAAADIMDIMPLMTVSDHLTGIAEVILTQALQLAQQHLHRHRTATGTLPGMAIIGYGKLGGIELGYGSDLDLVFLYPTGQTAHQGHYVRLAQYLIHLLNTQTAAGTLYEVDMRLRPNGSSGLLISPIKAFAEYQQQDAWTWEHQALVRARFICGNPVIGQRFTTTRRAVLSRLRATQGLRQEVAEMRQRMLAKRPAHPANRFNIKQDRGGIADIEFLVQFGVLHWAKTHPALLNWTDNIRLLQSFNQEDLLSARDTRLLCDAYRAYRQTLHHLVLQEQAPLVNQKKFAQYRRGIIAIWDRLIG